MKISELGILAYFEIDVFNIEGSKLASSKFNYFDSKHRLRQGIFSVKLNKVEYSENDNQYGFQNDEFQNEINSIYAKLGNMYLKETFINLHESE